MARWLASNSRQISVGELAVWLMGGQGALGSSTAIFDSFCTPMITTHRRRLVIPIEPLPRCCTRRPREAWLRTVAIQEIHDFQGGYAQQLFKKNPRKLMNLIK